MVDYRAAEEKRQYARVEVEKHSEAYDCLLQIDGKNFQASLVNISTGGAQFRLDSKPSHNVAGKPGKIKYDNYDQPYLADKCYSIAWHNNDYIGVKFDEPLSKDYSSLYAYYRMRAG